MRDFPAYASEIEKNAEIAGEIVGMIELVGPDYANDILENLDKFSDLSVLINRSRGESANLDALFKHVDFIADLRKLSDRYKQENIAGGQDVLFANLDLFEKDPGYFLLAQDEPKFFVRLFQVVGDLSKVSSTLAYELLDLGLARDELIEVLGDIITGTDVNEPESKAPSDEETLSELENYNFLNPNTSTTKASPIAFKKMYVNGSEINTPIYKRDELIIGQNISGPAIIVETTGTNIIDDGWSGTLDKHYNLIL